MGLCVGAPPCEGGGAGVMVNAVVVDSVGVVRTPPPPSGGRSIALARRRALGLLCLLRCCSLSIYIYQERTQRIDRASSLVTEYMLPEE